MKKCPKCNRDIPDDAKICPYCGSAQKGYQPMKRTNKKGNYLYVVLALILIFSPTIINFFFLGAIDSSSAGEPDEAITVGDLQDIDQNTETVTYQFTSLTSFNKKVKHSDKYVANIKSAQKQLKKIAKDNDLSLSSDYLFEVTDQNNIYSYLSYTLENKDNQKISVDVQYDLSKQVNEIKVIDNQTNLESFKDMIVKDDSYLVVKDIINIFNDKETYDAYDSCVKSFNNLEDEFDERKDNLGNYGLGVSKTKKDSTGNLRVLANKDKYRLKMTYTTKVNLNKFI